MNRAVDVWSRIAGATVLIVLIVIAVIVTLTFAHQISDSPLIRRSDLNQRITTCRAQAHAVVDQASADKDRAIGEALVALADHGTLSPQFHQATDAITTALTQLDHANMVYSAAVQRSKDNPDAFAADC